MAERFFQCITDFIFVEHSPERADVIFVPGGNYPQAAQEAARLYKRGMAPLILPSGRYSILRGFFEGPAESEWAYLRQVLLEEGVPDEAILKEDEATFTYENAIKSRKVTEKLGIVVRRAIICCQAFHARRCLMYYQEQFPDTRFLIRPVETRGISRDNWYLDREKIDVVLGEVERCGGQFHEIMYRYADGQKESEAFGKDGQND